MKQNNKPSVLKGISKYYFLVGIALGAVIAYLFLHVWN